MICCRIPVVCLLSDAREALIEERQLQSQLQILEYGDFAEMDPVEPGMLAKWVFVVARQR